MDINIVTDYLASTSIPEACTGYEMVDTQQECKAKLATTISHPTSAKSYVYLNIMFLMLLKCPEYRKLK